MGIPITYKTRNYNDPTEIHVHPDGNDSGNGSMFQPVKTLTHAFELVSATRLTVRLAPGSYVESALLTWPNRREVRVLGAGCGQTSISVSGYSAKVFQVAPGAQSSTFTGYIEGVEIDHSGLTALATYGQIGFNFDNTSVTKKLNFSIKNCGWDWETVADQSIKVVHPDTGNAVRIYVSGDGSQQEIGASYFAVANWADRLHFENCWLAGSVTTVGADQLRVRLFRCVIPEHSVRVAVVCNSGLVTVTLVQCLQWTDYNQTVAEIFEKAEAANVTGSTAVIPTS